MDARIHVGVLTDFTRPLAEEWMDQGKCYGMDPDKFSPNTTNAARDAKRVCNGDPRKEGKLAEPCPVRMQCLAFIMAKEVEGRRFSIYGGMTGRERTALAKQLKQLQEKK